MDIILERAGRKVARHSSNVEVFTEGLSSVRTDSVSTSSPSHPFFAAGRPTHYSRSPRNLSRSRKTSAALDPYPSSPESQHLIRSVQRQHSMFTRFPSQTDDDSAYAPSSASGSPRYIAATRVAQRPESPPSPPAPSEEVHESKLWGSDPHLKHCALFVFVVQY